jgi:hypothetical protein
VPRKTTRAVQPELPLHLRSPEREAELRAHLAGRTDLLPVELDLPAALSELARQAERILELEVGEWAPAPWRPFWPRGRNASRRDEEGVESDECPDGYLLMHNEGRWQYLSRVGERLAEGGTLECSWRCGPPRRRCKPSANGWPPRRGEGWGYHPTGLRRQAVSQEAVRCREHVQADGTP